MMLVGLILCKKEISGMDSIIVVNKLKNFNFKKGVGIAIRKQVASYLAMKLLTTHSIRSIGNYLCKNKSSWVASYIHAYTNKTHSLANLQDLIPTLASLCCL